MFDRFEENIDIIARSWRRRNEERVIGARLARHVDSHPRQLSRHWRNQLETLLTRSVFTLRAHRAPCGLAISQENNKATKYRRNEVAISPYTSRLWIAELRFSLCTLPWSTSGVLRYIRCSQNKPPLNSVGS